MVDVHHFTVLNKFGVLSGEDLSFPKDIFSLVRGELLEGH